MMDFAGQQSLKGLYSAIGTGHVTEVARAVNHTDKPTYKDLNSPAEFELSEDQAKAFSEAIKFMEGPGKLMSLVGPAGSGKTFLMRKIALEVNKRGFKLYLSAPTHKATEQLAKSTGFNASTVHRVLGVSVKENNNTGERELKQSGEPQLPFGAFLIVDESSMLQLELLEIVRESARDLDCKVLFVGDLAQLNPVGEEPCVAVDRGQCPWPLFELTTIHRQAAKNPIIKVATAIRTAESGDDLPGLVNENKDGVGIFVIDKPRDWAKLMIDRCQFAEETGDRYIGYTNAAVDLAAKYIRAKRYGSDAKKPYLPGELLVVNERYKHKFKKTKNDGSQQDFTEIIENNTEVVITDVSRDNEFYLVGCDFGGRYVQFRAFENYHKRKLYLERLASAARRAPKGAPRKAAWKKFWKEINTIADLRSGVSLSVHKSQGSTFRDVFVNLNQIARCSDADERQRLAYVAITRASRAVYVTGDWS